MMIEKHVLLVDDAKRTWHHTNLSKSGSDNLREILHTGRRRFALKKVQPWNSVKVSFDIPKEAADQLRSLAVQGNARLIELGILTVEIVGQSNAIVVNKSQNSLATTTNSREATASPSAHSNPVQKPSSDFKLDDHSAKRVKIEEDIHPVTNNLIPTASANPTNLNPTTHYQPQQVNHRYEQVLHSTYPKNSGVTMPNSSHVHDQSQNSWSGYKVKVNGVHYYSSQQPSYDTRRYETSLSAQCSNPTSTTNTLQ
ncbi:unnamed protein product [Adineta ricciae]|uniref:Nuclear receptor coactivator 6 TRADD-N domain-containing protein n=1 Tax=Adineta ricciae TaxID=249248 RepID=A0A814LL44_ADIRI|nr:unnamed protein product [Adineta ricciae]